MEAQVLHFFQWLWGSWSDPIWSVFAPFWPLVWTLVKIVAIVAPLLGAVAYLTLARAQGDRLHAGAHRPQPRRSAAACCSRSPTASS